MNMKLKTKVLLSIECKNMKNPMFQKSRLDETLGAASWILQENKSPTFNEDGTVTTASVWGRIFGARKSKDEINKITDNMLKRAMNYADITDFTSEMEFSDVVGEKDEFQHAPVLLSDD